MGDKNKDFNYGYQPLDEFAQEGDGSGVHDKLTESYELESIDKNKSNDGLGALEEKPASETNANGLGVMTAAIFIIGEICGAGAISFPAALSKTGIYGLFLIVVVVFACVYAGLLLGHSWKRIDEQRQNKDPLRDPYPYMGEVAVGRKFRHFITVTLNVQLFLTCVVYLLLAAEIVGSFVSFHVGHIHQQGNLRLWLIILACIITPLTWLGTPKDFWFVAVAAAGSTTLALLLVWIKYGMIAPEDLGAVEKAPVTLGSFASAFGTFVFGFTGASLFPTIQSDMRNPGEFSKAAYLGYLGIFLLYVPTALGGYFVLGKDIRSSILRTLSHYDKVHHSSRSIVSIAECLFAAHFVTGFVLMLNPCLQQLGEFFKVPHKFCFQRVALRSLAMLAILVSCEIFPQFGPIVDLVGGSINVLLCFVFPITIYLKLYPETTTKSKLVMAAIIIFAVLGGTASTVSNAWNISKEFHKLYFAKGATGHPEV